MSLAKMPDTISKPGTRAVSTRRTLFSGAAAVVIGSGITAGAAASVADFVPAQPDAELIAMGIEGRTLGEEHRRVTVRWWDLEPGNADIDRVSAELDVSSDRLWELYERAVTLPATTPEGWRGKAELARHFLVVECEERDGKMVFSSPEQELVWSLLCDLTGRV